MSKVQRTVRFIVNIRTKVHLRFEFMLGHSKYNICTTISNNQEWVCTFFHSSCQTYLMSQQKLVSILESRVLQILR